MFNVQCSMFFVPLQANSRNMKVIDRIKTYTLLVLRSQALKYTVVIVLGVLIVGFLDENSLWNHLQNQQRIDELTEEKARYVETFKRDQNQIRELDRNPKAMEKIARERYFMKADDEDIFVMKDESEAAEEVQTPEPAMNHETAE